MPFGLLVTYIGLYIFSMIGAVREIEENQKKNEV